MGKENVDKLQSLKILNKDIEEMKNGFSVETDNRIINTKAIIVSYMMDLKATHLFLGIGGAYCDLCFYTKQECFLKLSTKDFLLPEMFNLCKIFLKT